MRTALSTALRFRESVACDRENPNAWRIAKVIAFSPRVKRHKGVLYQFLFALGTLRQMRPEKGVEHRRRLSEERAVGGMIAGEAP